MQFDEKQIDCWIKSFDSFREFFEARCAALFLAFGFGAELDASVLRVAHENWLKDIQHWLANYVPAQTRELSELKIVSLMLYRLTQQPFLLEVQPREYASGVYKPHPSLTSADCERIRQDLIHNGNIVIPFDLCYQIACLYETNRADRIQPFQYPLTEELRHEILTYLHRGQTEPTAIYLIFKAMFERLPPSA